MPYHSILQWNIDYVTFMGPHENVIQSEKRCLWMQCCATADPVCLSKVLLRKSGGITAFDPLICMLE